MRFTLFYDGAGGTEMSLYSQVWQPYSHVVSTMERAGVSVDKSLCLARSQEHLDKISQLDSALAKSWGKQINWKSPQQLASLLYDEKNLPIPPVKGSNESAVQLNRDRSRTTSRISLQWLRINGPTDINEPLELLLEYRTLVKREQFYSQLAERVKNGRIHCQLGVNTESGRLSASNPNLQQIPKRGDGIAVREVFRVEEGWLVAADFAGLEWRILAGVVASKYDDYSMVEEILAGQDPHSGTALRMGLCPGPVERVKEDYPEERDIGKNLGYKINYGGTPTGLALSLGVTTKRARTLIDTFYSARPGIARFHKDICDFARQTGYTQSFLGRRRYLDWSNPRRAERQAKNVIQSLAADVVALAMLLCNTVPDPELRELGWFNEELYDEGCRLLLQVHDELIFFVPEKRVSVGHSIRKNMSRAGEILGLSAPLGVDVGVGKNWRECK